MRNTLLERRHEAQLGTELSEVRAAQIPYFVHIVWQTFCVQFPRWLSKYIMKTVKTHIQNYKVFSDWAKVNQCELNETALSSKINWNLDEQKWKFWPPIFTSFPQEHCCVRFFLKKILLESHGSFCRVPKKLILVKTQDGFHLWNYKHI